MTETQVDEIDITLEALKPLTGGEEEATIDWDASNDAFEDELRRLLGESYPGVEVDIRRVTGIDGQDTRVVLVGQGQLILDDDEEQEIRELVGAIYEDGKFWVEKE